MHTIVFAGLCGGADNFVCSPPEALSWSNRRLLILEEILVVDPDVLCMQEVDHFSYFEQLLGKVGYAGKFFPKPSSPCLDYAHSNGPDGCAMFYKVDQLELLSCDTIVLQQNQLDTNQVSIMSNFKCRQSSAGGGGVQQREFTVATTHLKAKAGYHQLRLAQGLDLLERLRRFSADRPVLLCGDFNAPPTEAIVQALGADASGLRSVYKELSDDGVTETAYTTWKIRGGKRPGEQNVDTCTTIDYIWCDRVKVDVEALLSIPSEQDIGPRRLPSCSYPSDHLSLAAIVTFH